MLQRIKRLADTQQKVGRQKNRLHIRLIREQEKRERKEQAQAKREVRLATLQGQSQQQDTLQRQQHHQEVTDSQNELMSGGLAVPAVEAAQSRSGRAIRKPGRFRT